MAKVQQVRFSDLCNPTERQREFWEAVDDPNARYILYGGARGGGKSYILRWTLVRLLLKWYFEYGLRDVRVGLLCEDYPTLYDRQISKVKIEFPSWLGKYVHDAKEFRLKKQFGGGIIAFRNLDDPSKYQSAEFAAIAVDELTKNTEEVFTLLRSSMRWPKLNAAGQSEKFMAATNPGGIGHLWVKQYFVSKQYPDHLFELAPKFRFVQSLPSDNPYLGEDYMAELRGLPPKLRMAFLEGSWDVFEGQVFEEWRADQHVIKDFEPPPNWTFACGMDWGMRAPGWWGLFAIGPEGDVVCIDEFYFKDMYARDVGREIGRRMLKYPVMYVACDEQAWYNTGVGSPTIAEELKIGVGEVMGQASPPLIQAMHGRGSRLAKLQVMHRYLAFKTTRTVEVVDGVERETLEVKPWNRPMLRFTERCANAIRTIPALPYAKGVKKGVAEDVDTDSEDHAYDGVCAFLMSRPQPAEEWPGVDDPDRHPGMSRGGKRKLRPYQMQALHDRALEDENANYRMPRQWTENKEWM